MMPRPHRRASAPLPILPSSAMVGLPEIVQPNPNPAGHPPRLFRVIGDSMAPTLQRGDLLLAVPVSAYHCEGLYLLSFAPGHVALYRCEIQGRDLIRAWKDNVAAGFDRLELSRAEFEEAVLAQVAMTARVVAGGLMPEAQVQGVVA